MEEIYNLKNGIIIVPQILSSLILKISVICKKGDITRLKILPSLLLINNLDKNSEYTSFLLQLKSTGIYIKQMTYKATNYKAIN